MGIQRTPDSKRVKAIRALRAEELKELKKNSTRKIWLSAIKQLDNHIEEYQKIARINKRKGNLESAKLASRVSKDYLKEIKDLQARLKRERQRI